MNFDIGHTLKESQGDNLVGIKTILGKKALQKGLTFWSSDVHTLNRRAKNILLLRKTLIENPQHDKFLQDAFAQIADYQEIFNEQPSEWKDKTSEQIFFEKDGHGGFLNHIPGVVLLIVFMKVWVAPILAIASPFIMFILPYFMLRFVYQINMPWSRYQSLALDMFLGERTLNLNTITKIIYFMVSLSQAIIQPFLTAMAVNKLDILVKKRGIQLKNCKILGEQILDILKAAGINGPSLPGKCMPTESLYVLFAKDKDERWTTEYLGQILGDAEVLYCLAKDKRFKKPIWVPHTYLQIHGFHDISILENPKLSSVKFTQDNSHSLLTGPNRGGKSSNLRGILQNVLWAQTYGVAPCSLYKGSLFKWILSSLRVEDRPGTSSLFEREIEIATTILKQARTEGRGLVLIDEIFHSTNPPDGEKSARIFLEQLWEHPNIVSCVSTHVYSIVEDSPEHIQKICSFARKNEDDSITYEYTLRSGICKVSSVDDVLREKELLRPCAQSL
jgi:hypothetical protein